MHRLSFKSLLTLGLSATLCAFYSLSAFAGIAGSAHDFSDDGWANGEICITCHTPHNANTTVNDAPLWNHAVTSATYTVYSSTTLNATLGQPSGVSKLCLSCHDGTVALDSYGGATGVTMVTGAPNIGTDLSGTHPISFTFDTALATADGGLFDPATGSTSLGGTIATDLLKGSPTLECSACHDVHNKYSISKLLRISNAGSGLCLTCHNK